MASLAPPVCWGACDAVSAVDGHAVGVKQYFEPDAICIKSFEHREPRSGCKMTQQLQTREAWLFMVCSHGAPLKTS